MRDTSVITAYLDSNVLFSATYIASSPFRDFWNMRDVIPATSPYAITEVRRHIMLPVQELRFEELLGITRLVRDAEGGLIPSTITLVEKDRPILAAAIAMQADYLITGDKAHFAQLYGKRTSGVYVISPGDFFDLYADRRPPQPFA